ncbi:MAG: general secretion pathway protein GspK [Candidatus Omnitrophica bacterium]|nr:general secretion pathway protein GspK [Candidatus Omnitrophota bacterium]
MKRRNKGVVIIFVLIFTTAISLMAIFLSVRAKQYLSLFSDIRRDSQIENIAEMAVEMGKILLEIGQKKHIISEEPGYINRQYEVDGMRIEIVIEDENGKINPNKIFGSEKGKVHTHLLETYKRFFSVMGYPENLSDALLDWIDEDDIPRMAGAEATFYKTSGFSYTPANGPIYNPVEMLLVMGFTKDIVFGDDKKKGLINFITSFSDGKINVNTCQSEVLSALGFSVADIEKITAERARRPIEEKFLLGVNKEAYLKNRDIIVFKSGYFTISSRVIDEDGTPKEVKVYVKRTDKVIETIRMDIR